MKYEIERKPLPPALTSEEVFELLKEYKITGDKKIREKILCGTIRLVADYVNNHCYNIINCLSSTYPSVEDLIQEGACVILHSIETFDVLNGAQFSTYLTHNLKTEIGKLYRKSKTKKRDGDVCSFNQLLDKDEDKSSRELEDTIEDKIDYEQNIADKIDLKYIKNQILSMFSKQEKEIFIKYYFENLTQQQIAEELEVSRQYVSQKLRSTTQSVVKIYEKGIASYKPRGKKQHNESERQNEK